MSHKKSYRCFLFLFVLKAKNIWCCLSSSVKLFDD